VKLFVEIERGIAFWTAAQGYVVRQASDDFTVLTDPDRRWSFVLLQVSAESKHSPNSVPLDHYTTNQSSEVRTSSSWRHGASRDNT